MPPVKVVVLPALRDHVLHSLSREGLCFFILSIHIASASPNKGNDQSRDAIEGLNARGARPVDVIPLSCLLCKVDALPWKLDHASAAVRRGSEPRTAAQSSTKRVNEMEGFGRICRQMCKCEAEGLPFFRVEELWEFLSEPALLCDHAVLTVKIDDVGKLRRRRPRHLDKN